MLVQRVLPPGCPRRRRDVRRRRLSTHRLAPSGAGRPGPQRASQQMCSGDWPLLQSESMHEWFGQRACCSAAHGGVAMRDAAGSPHTGSPDVGWGGQDPSESQHGPRQHVPPQKNFVYDPLYNSTRNPTHSPLGRVRSAIVRAPASVSSLLSQPDIRLSGRPLASRTTDFMPCFTIP